MAQAVPQLERYKNGGNFNRFLEQFEDYVALTGARPRIDLLFLSLVDGITWEKIGRVKMEGPVADGDQDPRADVARVVAFYRESFTRVEDRRGHQAQFTMVQQKEGESMENYGRRLEDLAGKAYPVDAVRLELQNAAFVRGILDDRVKIQLIQLDDMGYRELVNKALRCEQATAMLDPGRGRGVFGQEIEGGVNQTSERRSERDNGRNGSGRVGELAFTAECYSCGKKGHLQRDCEDVKCYHCEGNHIKRNCPSLNTKNNDRQGAQGRGGRWGRGSIGKTFASGRGGYSNQGPRENSAAYMAKKCSYCNLDGHLYENCWRRQAELWKNLNGMGAHPGREEEDRAPMNK